MNCVMNIPKVVEPVSIEKCKQMIRHQFAGKKAGSVAKELELSVQYMEQRYRFETTAINFFRSVVLFCKENPEAILRVELDRP